MPNVQKTVLVVDDSRATRLMIRKSLEENGFNVIEAESGEKALEIFEQVQPDAILLDVEMPGIDGITTCSNLRKTDVGQYIPIMMVTSHDDPNSINKAYEAGATEFTIKPINWAIMGHRMRYLIRTGENFLKFKNTNPSAYQEKNIEALNGFLTTADHYINDALTYLGHLKTRFDKMNNLNDVSPNKDKIDKISKDCSDLLQNINTNLNDLNDLINTLKK